MAKTPPAEVVLIRREIRRFFDQVDGKTGGKIGSASCGAYVFYDFDGEPICVGRTVASLRDRVRRHLTGRRSDPVAKFVLDPFEVLTVEVWPMFEMERSSKAAKKAAASAAEYQVFRRAIRKSEFGAVLNEGGIPRPVQRVRLPRSWKGSIVPEPLYSERRHPDIRIARRAQTIASLTRLISERRVNDEIRQTLLVQAQRLEHLTRKRLA